MSQGNSETNGKLEHFNMRDSIRILDKMSDKLLENMIRLEEIGNPKLSLKNIFKVSMQRIEGNGDKYTTDIINWFVNNFAKNGFAELFNMPYIGITVFFMPGTDKPISIFYGDWAKDGKDTAAFGRNDFYKNGKYNHYNIEHFVGNEGKGSSGRILQVSKLMRHLDKQRTIDPDDKKTHLKEHFFFWIKNFIDLQCMHKTPYSPVNKPTTGNVAQKYYLAEANQGSAEDFSKSLSLLAMPYEAKEPCPEIIFKNSGNAEGKIIKLRWELDTAYSHPYILTSPVYVNNDTLVLVASFFPPSIAEPNNMPIEQTQDILTVHNLISHCVFGPLYNTILREGNHNLMESLGRLNVSRNLLECASQELRDTSNKGDEKPFTYYWDDRKEERFCCADFRSHIYDDLQQNPENIFEIILKLEENIYSHLKKDWDENNVEGIKKYFNKYDIPRDLPFASLLRNIENTQRYLKMENRDHLIHQFQVFVLGTIFIKQYKDEFIESFVDTFNPDSVPKKESSDSEPKNNSKNKLDILYAYLFKKDEQNKKFVNSDAIEHLLKLSWFLTSIYHDIGYPVETIDNLMGGLRKEVSGLLSMEKSYQTPLPDFKIDSVLYDDPRAYVLLKRIAYDISDYVDKGEKQCHEQWWYLIRNLAFDKKRHEFISILTLGLHFAGKSYDMNEFLETTFGTFLRINVLMPIALHHITKWKKLRDKKIEKYADTDQEKCNAVCNLLPTLSNIKVHFHRLPLSALLTFCDSIQETGRPSGSRKDSWPDIVKDIFEHEKCNGKIVDEKTIYNLIYNYKSTNTDNFAQCKQDYLKKQELMTQVRSYFDFGPLNDIYIRFDGKYNAINKSVIDFETLHSKPLKHNTECDSSKKNHKRQKDC